MVEVGCLRGLARRSIDGIDMGKSQIDTCSGNF